ncbi:MAG: hypothetical protein M3255_02255 [Pseudomonadota bacterium]|nr:hypothetical protein [Pseudomonadota bacterium]
MINIKKKILGSLVTKALDLQGVPNSLTQKHFLKSYFTCQAVSVSLSTNDPAPDYESLHLKIRHGEHKNGGAVPAEISRSTGLDRRTVRKYTAS